MGDEVGVLGKALDVLECLVRRDGMSVAELADATGITRPAAYRILNTLRRRGYVMTQADPSRYALGPAMYAYGVAIDRGGGLRALAAPVLRSLSAEFGETVNLGVPRGASVLYVDIVESEHRLRTSVGVGDVDPMRSTALGKAMLAALPDAEARDLLAAEEPRARTPQTKLDVDELLADLAAVRSRGFALDDEENVAGSRCVAAAVPDGRGRPLAAVSVSAPVSRMPLTDAERIGARVGEVAERLGAELGGR